MTVRMLSALREEWDAVKRKSPADRLKWLQDPKAIILLGANVVRQQRSYLEKVRRRIYAESCTWPIRRDAWEYGQPIAQTLGCLCERCNGRKLWPPQYFVQERYSFECAIESQPGVEDELLQPPSSGGSVIDHRAIKSAQRRGEAYRARF